jgi:hypothetical protein
MMRFEDLEVRLYAFRAHQDKERLREEKGIEIWDSDKHSVFPLLCPLSFVLYPLSFIC